MLTNASATLPPEASFTFPSIVPPTREVCAIAAVASAKNRRANGSSLLIFLRMFSIMYSVLQGPLSLGSMNGNSDGSARAGLQALASRARMDTTAHSRNKQIPSADGNRGLELDTKRGRRLANRGEFSENYQGPKNGSERRVRFLLFVTLRRIKRRRAESK